MPWLLVLLLAVVMVGIVVVMFYGLVSLKRGDSPQRSQKLMQWRVGLQLVAVLLVVALLYTLS